MPNVTTQNVANKPFMLSVIMLSVVVLNVEAPKKSGLGCLVFVTLDLNLVLANKHV
jgi:hypothetical protein